MNYRKITVNAHEDIAIITINDPDTLNAMGFDVVEELDEAFVKAAGDSRAIVLTGNGRGFSSGANLSAGDMGGAAPDFDAGSGLDSHYNPFMMRMRESSLPIVTAINGAAAGIGCSIALAGDIIVASEQAYFLQAFRRIGLVPDGGSSWLLPRMIGRARAMEMMLLGEKVPARQAYEWGMVNAVVPADKLMPAALDYAKRLADGPSRALRMTRELGWAGLENSFEEQLALERKMQRDAGRTADFKEGVTAFLEKRQAKFG